MSQPITAPGVTRSWPPRRPTRSQTCQPSRVSGRFCRAGQSWQAFGRARLAGATQFAQYLAPRRIPTRRGRGGVFFLFQQQALGDVSELEGLEDRPDVQKRVDGLGARVDGVAVRVTDALPGENRASRKRLGKHHGALLVGDHRRTCIGDLRGVFVRGHRRAPPRRPDRCASPPSARWSAGAAAPARRGPGHASAARWSGRVSASSILLDVVDQGGGAHADGAVARGLPVKAGLHALRPGNLDARARQVDGVHGEGETLARGQDIGEFHLAGIATHA